MEERYKDYIVGIAGCVIIIMIFLMLIKICFIPNYTTEATVETVGSKGITVSYTDEYGKSIEEAEVDVNSVSEYNVGDTITINVYETRVEIARRC